MKRKFLFTMTLLLCLSTVALAKECARYWCRTHCKLQAHSAVRASTAEDADVRMVQENHLLLHTFIKLLYI